MISAKDLDPYIAALKQCAREHDFEMRRYPTDVSKLCDQVAEVLKVIQMEKENN